MAAAAVQGPLQALVVVLQFRLCLVTVVMSEPERGKSGMQCMRACVRTCVPVCVVQVCVVSLCVVRVCVL